MAASKRDSGQTKRRTDWQGLMILDDYLWTECPWASQALDSVVENKGKQKGCRPSGYPRPGGG